MRHPVPNCQPGEKLEGVLDRMKEDALPLMPVVEEGRLLGLITPENSVEFVAIRRALAGRV